MNARRVIVVGLAASAIITVFLFLASPFPAMIVWMAKEELFPATISWDGKSAWKRCDSAIAGKTSWPATPQGACKVMHMCANEANLSEEQVEMLTQAIRETKGCQAP